MKVKTNVKAGGTMNHNKVKVRTGVKAGGIDLNHNKKKIRVKSGVKAGQTTMEWIVLHR